jgi:hypothetical protein
VPNKKPKKETGRKGLSENPYRESNIAERGKGHNPEKVK